MVQLPVLPLADPQSRWIGGHYLDEFAESHGKDLVVREALGASVPSAGVGCAIHRNMMARIIAMNVGRPVEAARITAHYVLDLRIGALDGRDMIDRHRAGPEAAHATPAPLPP